jgi:peptidoglycan/xylan/chitin deacetylase (PgdA/CDA1 family)
MKVPYLCSVAAAGLVLSTVAFSVQGVAAASSAPQVIILKLDDVLAFSKHNGPPVSPRWQRVADYIEKSHLKASFGIIGSSLECDNPAYFEWIKNLAKKGFIEFWNHGYYDRKPSDKTGEFEGSLEAQKDALHKTQTLAKQKLGFELRAFGPHWSGTTPDTAVALESFPEIKMWFYGDAKSSTKFLFPRVMTLENPTFVPDFEKFKSFYEKNAQTKPCLALQGHPNAWDDKRWAGFLKIVDFLQSRGCVFMMPSEYLKQVQIAGVSKDAR